MLPRLSNYNLVASTKRMHLPPTDKVATNLRLLMEYKMTQYDNHVLDWLRSRPNAMHLIMKYIYNKKQNAK